MCVCVCVCVSDPITLATRYTMGQQADTRRRTDACKMHLSGKFQNAERPPAD